MTRRVVNERGYVIGAGHHRAKLADSQIATLCALRDQGWIFRELAAHFQISETAAKDYCSGRRRAQVAAAGKPCKRTVVEAPSWSFEPLLRAWGGP